MQVILYVQFGIGIHDEAIKYFDEAQLFLNTGHFSEPKYTFYSTYVFLHILFYKAGFESVGLYLLQLAANLLAMLALYKLALTTTGKAKVALLAVLFTLLSYHWLLWTAYLYTESLFCNLLIVFACLLFGVKKYNLYTLASVALVMLLIVFTRPTGLLIIPVTGAVFFCKLWQKKKTAIAISGLSITLIVFIVILNYATQGSNSYNFIKPLLEHNVLCYIPYQQQPGMPRVYFQSNGLQSILWYIAQEPLQFIKLAGLRLLSFASLVRPHYSAFHNWYLALYYYPMYVFAIPGFIFFWQINRLLSVFVFTLFAMLAGCVMLTCDDWNNRFTMPIIPFIMLLAATGVYTCFVWVNKKLNNNK